MGEPGVSMKLVTILILAITVIATSTPLDAQDSAGSRAGQQIGQALFGRTNDSVYYDQLARAAQIRANMESARLAAAQTRTMELENELRSDLQRWWLQAGFPAEEASAIASAYRVDESQLAIFERAKRDGSKATFVAVANAYKSYNYLLADQLLLGAMFAQKVESQAGTTQDVPSTDHP